MSPFELTMGLGEGGRGWGVGEEPNNTMPGSLLVIQYSLLSIFAVKLVKGGLQECSRE